MPPLHHSKAQNPSNLKSVKLLAVVPSTLSLITLEHTWPLVFITICYGHRWELTLFKFKEWTI